MGVVGVDYKEIKGNSLGVMGMFCILMVVTQVTFIKTDPTYTSRGCILFYFNKIDLKIDTVKHLDEQYFEIKCLLHGKIVHKRGTQK